MWIFCLYGRMVCCVLSFDFAQKHETEYNKCNDWKDVICLMSHCWCIFFTYPVTLNMLHEPIRYGNSGNLVCSYILLFLAHFSFITVSRKIKMRKMLWKMNVDRLMGQFIIRIDRSFLCFFFLLFTGLIFQLLSPVCVAFILICFITILNVFKNGISAHSHVLCSAVTIYIPLVFYN